MYELHRADQSAVRGARCIVPLRVGADPGGAAPARLAVLYQVR
jgi:hypothetical protein